MKVKFCPNCGNTEISLVAGGHLVYMNVRSASSEEQYFLKRSLKNEKSNVLISSYI
tara:strand:+ start:2474 stop:2641 length:168 start_codon:yes stop_codon:yes gene_type:complete